MDGPPGHSAKRSKCDTEKQISYDLIYMWHVSNTDSSKIKPTQTKTKKIQHTKTDRQLPGVGRVGKVKCVELVKRVKRYKFPVIKRINHRDVPYSVVTVVNSVPCIWK